MQPNYRVTAGLLVPPVHPTMRLTEERRILGERFPGFAFTPTAGELLAVATGSLTTFDNRAYRLRVELSRLYPYELPAIFPDGWEPKRNPHVYSNGQLCIMRGEQWIDSMSIAFAVAKAALWLNKYEVWAVRGIWPGAEQHNHGFIYTFRKKLHGL